MTAGIGLIVPVRLDALMIGERDALYDNYFAPPYADFSTLPCPGGLRLPYLSSVAVQQPFNGNAPMPPGIHLHWQLPYAIRKGSYGDSGAMTLPHAPDRWLVTRIIADLANPSAPPQLRSWVIESNYLSTTSGHSPTTIPWDATSPQTYRWLGRVYDYDAWLAGGQRGTYWDDLTAMGYGVPAFAAYYPNCRNVFGFLDSTLNNASFDPDKTAIAYVVAGWYSNPQFDPLREGPVEGWIYDAPNGETPEYSLYQGVVYGLRWRPNIAYFPGYDVSLAPEIAIGNTPSEAFSALAAWKLRDLPFPNVETLLNALQLGVLPYLGDPNGTAQMEEALFSAQFAAQDGSTLWQLTPKQGENEAARFEAFAKAGETLAEKLEALNDAQRELDEEIARRRSLQLQIFADWNKYMVIKYANTPARYPSLQQVYQFLTSEIAVLDQMALRIAQLTSDVETLQAAVADALPPELALESVAGPRFYQSDDLVVVLSGDGVPPPPPDAASEAVCILTSQLLRAIELPAGVVGGSSAITFNATSLPQLANLPYAALGEITPAAMLADPQLAPVLTSMIAAQGGASNPAVLDAAATAAAIKNAQDAMLADEPSPNGIAFDGALPQHDISFRAFETPWNPIELSWRFAYAPLAGSEAKLDPNYVLDNFVFDESSLDFEPRAQNFAPVTDQYTGAILLSPDASINVQREIRKYLQYFDDPELQEILEALGNYPLLAQSLGGFNAALMMLSPTMQLPVADPAATDAFFARFSNVTVHDAVGDQNKVAPVTASLYNPLRAGKLRLTELVLTDSFGRFRTINLSRLIVADTIPTTSFGELLPPLRMSQTVRADIRWLSAINPRTDTNTIPATHPICGWVVPNHLDASLMFYDADGSSIGTLLSSGDNQRLLWQDAPGSGTPGGTMDAAFENRNAVLRDFAFSVRTNGPAYVGSLIRTIDRTRIFIGPQNEQQNLQTAVLIGAPLAIVQSRASLRLLGLPSPEQSYAALQTDMDRGDPLRRSVHDFTSVRFPLLLGSQSQFNDGLIGFFDGNDFARFYAAAANGDDAHIVKPQTGTITLAAADPDRVITMLVDPRAGVHAFTGITPVKILEIPSDAVALALRTMAFTFLTSPILSLESGLAIPRPGQLPSASWTWVAYGADGKWIETDIAGINYEATLQTPRALLEGWMKLTERNSTEEE